MHTQLIDSIVHEEQISDVCRIVADTNDEIDFFTIRLQTCILQAWVTIASYEYAAGRSRRHLLRRDGVTNTIKMELPHKIVFDMAVSDFKANWQKYYDNYFVLKEANKCSNWIPHFCCPNSSLSVCAGG